VKKYDVTALGELLIDFTENGISPQGNPLLEANPGGAPCNVLAMLSKLGKHTAFIGKVGADMFGRQLSETIKEVGICADGLVADAGVPTTLAFVHTFAGGEREFSFIRDADQAGSAYRFDSGFQNLSLWYTFLDPCRRSGSHQICHRYRNRKRSNALL
jgi:sugar/nucleoside kinase (ribokinase family)